MPRSEITKLRPAIYQQHQQMIRMYEKLQEQDSKERKNDKEANKILDEIKLLRVNKDQSSIKDQLRKVEIKTHDYQLDQIPPIQSMTNYTNSVALNKKKWPKGKNRPKKTSSFLAVTRQRREENFVQTRQTSPAPGNYVPKYTFVFKRPQTNLFSKSHRFSEEVNAYLDKPLDQVSPFNTEMNITNFDNTLNRSQMSRSQIAHERTKTATNLEKSLEMMNHSTFDRRQMYNASFNSEGTDFTKNKPILCVSFDKQIPRRDITESVIQPHEERFKFQSFYQRKYSTNEANNKFYRLQNLAFDRQSRRKDISPITNSGGFQYNYQEAQDKIKFDESIKKTLPFQREKINYEKLHKKIDLSKLKRPKEIISGKALRRKVMMEDELLIYDLVLRPQIIKQMKLKQEQDKIITVDQLYEEYQRSKQKIEKKKPNYLS
ncbi:UNKNOWN [Stylonychia lemnae]|uniref:Uncharacterized protein n=1 Tax=Stylonychia lemnae TaxID=5949 RepID=A0A078AL79_STYLE|nr:UNKNOWN [Stylonychia lemnae]|eukprot:CDW82954.1 UNKNOWN [Stylonychia lemnae]